MSHETYDLTVRNRICRQMHRSVSFKQQILLAKLVGLRNVHTDGHVPFTFNSLQRKEIRNPAKTLHCVRDSARRPPIARPERSRESESIQPEIGSGPRKPDPEVQKSQSLH